MFQTRTLTTDVVAEYVALYNKGEATLATIASKIGCSVPTAGRFLKKNGAIMRGAGRPKGSKTVNRKPKKTAIADTQLQFTATVVQTPTATAVETPTEKLAASPVEDNPFLAFQQRVINYNS